MGEKIRITTDNEWAGKYELLEQQFSQDGIKLAALGDLLPTRTGEQVGDATFFKTKIKELGKDAPKRIEDKIAEVYRRWPDGLIENYGKCGEHIQKGAKFLRGSSLPVIQAIMGNREFDYQKLLSFLTDKTDAQNVNYMDRLAFSGKFNLYKKPKVEKVGSTSMLWLPYHPEADREFSQGLESTLNQLRELKGERIAIMTHENPCPEAFGANRKVKMQKTLDDYIAASTKISPNVTLFCGHLDISADPKKYKGATIQPISGTESIVLDRTSGRYEKQQMAQRGAR